MVEGYGDLKMASKIDYSLVSELSFVTSALRGGSYNILNLSDAITQWGDPTILIVEHEIKFKWSQWEDVFGVSSPYEAYKWIENEYPHHFVRVNVESNDDEKIVVGSLQIEGVEGEVKVKFGNCEGDFLYYSEIPFAEFGDYYECFSLSNAIEQQLIELLQDSIKPESFFQAVGKKNELKGYKSALEKIEYIKHLLSLTSMPTGVESDLYQGGGYSSSSNDGMRGGGWEGSADWKYFFNTPEGRLMIPRPERGRGAKDIVRELFQEKIAKVQKEFDKFENNISEDWEFDYDDAPSEIYTPEILRNVAIMPGPKDIISQNDKNESALRTKYEETIQDLEKKLDELLNPKEPEKEKVSEGQRPIFIEKVSLIKEMAEFIRYKTGSSTVKSWATKKVIRPAKKALKSLDGDAVLEDIQKSLNSIETLLVSEIMYMDSSSGSHSNWMIVYNYIIDNIIPEVIEGLSGESRKLSIDEEKKVRQKLFIFSRDCREGEIPDFELISDMEKLLFDELCEMLG
jgi:hypothetical protein